MFYTRIVDLHIFIVYSCTNFHLSNSSGPLVVTDRQRPHCRLPILYESRSFIVVSSFLFCTILVCRRTLMIASVLTRQHIIISLTFNSGGFSFLNLHLSAYRVRKIIYILNSLCVLIKDEQTEDAYTNCSRHYPNWTYSRKSVFHWACTQWL